MPQPNVVTSLYLVPSRLLQRSPLLPSSKINPSPSTASRTTQPALSSKTPKSDHITPLLRSLHWLPVSKRIQYKFATLCHKCIHNSAPADLSDCLQLCTTDLLDQCSTLLPALSFPPPTVKLSEFRAPNCPPSVLAPSLPPPLSPGTRFPSLSARYPH